VRSWVETAGAVSSAAPEKTCTQQLQSPLSRLTCASHVNYADHMSRMIQVRNVPDALHQTLKIRATRAGMSLSDYLLAELQHIAERPTLLELRERIHHRAPVRARVSAAHAVRAEREAR
jgi:antitoxin FitA